MLYCPGCGYFATKIVAQMKTGNPDVSFCFKVFVRDGAHEGHLFPQADVQREGVVLAVYYVPSTGFEYLWIFFFIP